MGPLQVLLAGILLALSSVIVSCLAAFIRDPFDLRRFPAPSCAGFSSIWSAYHSRKLRRSRAILEAHQQLGPVVRIQPRHVSFADSRAVRDIYGHKSSIIKDTFYETISGGEHENIVSTRDRAEHARKRRYVAHVFSHRNVVGMEPLVAHKARLLVDRLDKAAEDHEAIDIRQWLNYFTFDVISAMAFSNDAGFLRTGKSEIGAESADGKKTYTMDPIKAFQDNTIHVASIGHWPRFLAVTKPVTRWFPYSRRGDEFNDMCIRQIRTRLQAAKDAAENGKEEGNDGFSDFFQSLLTDSNGKHRDLPFGELVQEASVFLSAGSDTTASAMTNTLYLLLKHPRALEKLRQELYAAVTSQTREFEQGVPTFAAVSPLRYLRACLDEGLRHLPPTSIGLLRQTPPGGAQIAGHWIKGGVTVSVPTYSLHHDPNLFSDPWTYNPARWIDGSEQERENLRNFVIPFTLGRHACIGRNIAFLEQYLVLSTLLHRYDFDFVEEGFELAVLERINANPGPMRVHVRRRV